MLRIALLLALAGCAFGTYDPCGTVEEDSGPPYPPRPPAPYPWDHTHHERKSPPSAPTNNGEGLPPNGPICETCHPNTPGPPRSQ